MFTCLFYGTVIAGCIYLGFFLGSIIHPDMTLYTFVPVLKEQMANPLKIKVTAYTPYTMAAVFLTALLSVMVQKTNQKNYRFGKNPKAFSYRHYSTMCGWKCHRAEKILCLYWNF